MNNQFHLQSFFAGVVAILLPAIIMLFYAGKEYPLYEDEVEATSGAYWSSGPTLEFWAAQEVQGCVAGIQQALATPVEGQLPSDQQAAAMAGAGLRTCADILEAMALVAREVPELDFAELPVRQVVTACIVTGAIDPNDVRGSLEGCLGAEEGTRL